MKDFFLSFGFEIKGIRHLSARDAYAAIEKGAFLLDIREEYLTCMKTFKVTNYILCPLSKIMENINILPEQKPLIVADATGVHSKDTVKMLADNGFIVANLAGGIMDWEQDGFPVKNNSDQTLSGQCLCMLKPMNKARR